MSGDNMTNMHTHMHTHTAAANNTPLRPATLPTPSIDQSPITPEALGIAKTQFTRRKRDKDNEAEKKEKKKGGQGNNDVDEARHLTSCAIVENNRVNQDGSMSPLGADDIFHMAQDHHLVKKFKFVEAIGVGNWVGPRSFRPLWNSFSRPCIVMSRARSGRYGLAQHKLDPNRHSLPQKLS